VGAIIVLVFVPLSPAYDLADFVRAGHAVLHGGAVYPAPASAAAYSGSAFVYPYLIAWPFVPLALVSRDVGVAAFFAASFGALAAVCLAQSRDGIRTALVLACSFAVTGLQLGALSPLLAAGALGLWRLRERPRALALLAAPVLAAKLFLLPLLSWLLLARRFKALAGACVATGLLLGAGFVLGPLGPGGYLRLLAALGDHESRAGFGLVGTLVRSGLPASVADATAALCAALLMLSAQRHHRRHGDERVLYCAALLACLALSPVVWSHYLLLLAVVLLVMDLPRAWLVAALGLSWLTAPAHGIRIGDDTLAASRPALWMLIALVLAGLYGVAARPRGHAEAA
jgi:hypothetical protein